eukprot:TRINITY_DN291_c0_g1_i2.p1 TRINITY_DN291_c0_g1~~TRINITY_DN291_c0_g1_i2.p1  ORF type:complete len:445 (-),score=146.35 TRINITY_DN291_c0_g1_i2:598-1932(-)
MTFKTILLGLCLAGSLSAAPQEEKQPRRCEEACAAKFEGQELLGCNTGCRLMDIEESLSLGTQGLDAVKSRCQFACHSSYGPTDKTMKACSQGCEFMIPHIKSRHQSMRDPFASFFGNDHLLNRIHLPQIFPFVNGGPLELKEGKQQQQEKEAKDQIEPRSLFGGTNFGNMFSNIHSIMESVLQKFKSGELGGHGKLVVIKAGPGHYETETYDLSPQNANEHNNNMNDMMNKMNPLDDFFKAPHNMNKKEDEEDLFGVDFVKPIKSSSSRLIEERQKEAEAEEEEDNWGMGPILPETGLKSRIVHQENNCNRHPEYMSWTNYFYCVDRRISSSGWWIYVCVLPLACLLLLRICMLMARREADTLLPLPLASHKDILAKAKEAEASVISIVTVPDYKLKSSDLPPAYEDVANTNLKVSIATPEKKKGDTSSSSNDEEPKSHESKA